MIVKYLLKIAMLGSSWVMYVLLALSVASIGAMVERWLFFRKRGADDGELGDTLCDLFEQGEREKGEALLRASTTVEAEVVAAALRWAGGGPQAFEAGIDGELTRRRRELERGMTLLGTLGNNAPFIGLLGTVIGVIVAFADLADGQNKVQMDKVMGGIAEALVATGVGLFVAIPAVVAYNVFQKKIADIEDNVSSIGKRLSALLAVTAITAPPHLETAPAALPVPSAGELAPPSASPVSSAVAIPAISASPVPPADGSVHDLARVEGRTAVANLPAGD